MMGRDGRRLSGLRWTRRNPHRISMYEALCYTLALLLAAAIALGWFDLVIPWGS
jgi:cellulose synthase (UDP-forming)